jgi:hypothetical protein
MLYVEALEIFEASRDASDKRSRLVRQTSEARRLLPGAVLAVDPPVLDADGAEVTVRDLCEHPDPAAALRAATGAPTYAFSVVAGGSGTVSSNAGVTTTAGSQPRLMPDQTRTEDIKQSK